MSRTLKYAALGAAISTAVLYGCSGGSAMGVAELQITVSPATIDDKGMASTVTFLALDETGKPGTGSVTATSVAGSLKDGQSLTLDGDGKATAMFSCSVALDPTCTGFIKITGEWTHSGKVTISKNVKVTTSTGVGGGGGGGAVGGGAGGGGGGGAGGGGGGTAVGGGAGGGGVGGGTGGGASDAGVGGLTLTAARAKIYLGVGDTSALTATLTTPDGGPFAGEPIKFTTTLGSVTVDGGTTFDTNASGVASGLFSETGSPGMAMITATHTPSGKTAMTTVEVLAVQQIQFTSATCGATACTVMGIKGSGFNEVAQVKFKVTDSQNNKVVGVSVTFSVLNPPQGTMFSPSAITDMNGEVVANVSSGPKIGSFSVHATVVPGSIEADSPTIGIRGAKPTNKGFVFFCNPVNVDAYHAPVPPASFQPTCTIKLIDRFLNPVGTGTSVSFKSEAGSITNSVATTAFNPSGANNNEGYGTVTFDTNGVWPATDVTPLPASPTQYPYPRLAEPSRTAGALIRNPRDGLVSVIAYVQGEEYFDDTNTNGVHDANEPFVDQGEPLVDSNDNGTQDPGETFIDTNNNLTWDGPNGTWDGNTTIWSETRILYSNYAEPGLGSLTPATWNVAKGTTAQLDVRMPDLNLNRSQSQSTSVSATHSATKGSIALSATTLQDGYGFVLDRQLVDATTEGVCTPGVTPICKYKYLFGDWYGGYVSTITVTGAAVTDLTPASPDSITISITTNGTNTQQLFSGGTIQ